MGVLHYLISDLERVGIELGKFFLDEQVEEALSDNPLDVERVAALLRDDNWSKERAAVVAKKLSDFCVRYPDWRDVNDCGWDGDVADKEEWADILRDGEDPYDPYFPVYWQIDSIFDNAQVFTLDEVAAAKALRPPPAPPPAAPVKRVRWKPEERACVDLLRTDARLVFDVKLEAGETREIAPARAFLRMIEEVSTADLGPFHAWSIDRQVVNPNPGDRVHVSHIRTGFADTVYDLSWQHSISALPPASSADNLRVTVKNESSTPIKVMVCVNGRTTQEK